jgi:hypothetical protein
LLAALATLASGLPNLAKAVVMVLILLKFLSPLKAYDLVIFFSANVIFVIGDYLAVQNGFFYFLKPDVLGLPYWEFVSWGFWIVFAYRILPKHFPQDLDFRAVLMAMAFSLSFGVFQDTETLLLVTSAIVAFGFLTFRSAVDVEYVLMFSTLGLVVEAVGLRFGLWGYREQNLWISGVQFIVMWAGTGFLFRNLIGPFLLEKKNQQYVHRCAFEPWSTSTGLLAWGKPHSYQDYLRMSDLALNQANMRGSIECLREALYSAQSSKERARAHILLGQRYRMIVQMRNAKRELELAFQEMNMDLPCNYILQTLKASVYFVYAVLEKSKIEMDPSEREVLELKVGLYEEIGLSGYYMHENLTMLQASMMAYGCAKKLGPSLEQINWLGATICVLTLKGWSLPIRKLKSKAEQILNENSDPVLHTKWQVWMALAADYAGNSLVSAGTFHSILHQDRKNLMPADLHMVAMTLSLNYLLRGKFRESMHSIDMIFSNLEDKGVNLFSQLRPYVEWCKLGAMSFLEPQENLLSLVQTSKAIFSFTDHEEWAITQYLGHRLLMIYNSGSKEGDLINEIEDRFRFIQKTPKKIFLEANFFWIALALVRLEQFGRKEISQKQVAKLLRELTYISSHPVRKHFVAILKQRFLILKGSTLNSCNDLQFEEELVLADNLFALQENRKNIILSEKRRLGAR